MEKNPIQQSRILKFSYYEEGAVRYKRASLMEVCSHISHWLLDVVEEFTVARAQVI